MVTLILIGLLSVPGLPSRDTVVPLPPVQQGIEGRVVLAAGNLMPSPRSGRRPRTDGPGTMDTIYIYELTHISQVVRQSAGSPYYLAIHSRLVKSAVTDTAGRFRIALPPGWFSIFTKKGSLFYASRMDEKNNIAPVEVVPGMLSMVKLRVASDHKPVY